MECQNRNCFCTSGRQIGECWDRVNKETEHIVRRSVGISVQCCGKIGPGLQQFNIALVTPDGREYCLSPEHHLRIPCRVHALALFSHQCARGTDQVVRMANEFFQFLDDSGRSCGYNTQRCGKYVERIVKLFSEDGLKLRIVCVSIQGCAHEHQCICNSCAPLRIHQGTFDHLAAGIANGNKVSRKITAINRGDVLGIQRTKILSIIPVVEVATKTLKSVHGCKRCIQPFRRFMYTNPAEVIRGDRGEKI